jgi:hypothetical protein
LIYFKRDYKTKEEFADRLEIFRDNLKYFEWFNAQDNKFKVGITRFSDMSHPEYLNLIGGKAQQPK